MKLHPLQNRRHLTKIMQHNKQHYNLTKPFNEFPAHISLAIYWTDLRLHKTFAGVLKKKSNKLYIKSKVMNCRFRKNIRYMRRAFFKTLEAGKQNTTECHSAGLIGYQTPSLFQKNCTISISKDQSQKECQDFPDFLLVIFL